SHVPIRLAGATESRVSHGRFGLWTLDFGLSRFSLCQNPLDSLVQNIAVGMDLDALCIRFPFDQIEPAASVWIFVHQRNLLFQSRIPPRELAFGNAEEVGDGFEPFHPAHDLPRLDGRARLD